MDSNWMIERELTADQACQRIQTELSRLGMTPATLTLGQNVVAVQATFTDSNGLPVARGAGKGYADQAAIGALYETLEHYWTDSLPVQNAHAIPVDYFADNAMFNQDPVRLLSSQQNRRIACRRYTCPQRFIFLDPLGLPLGFGSVWGGVLNSSGELAVLSA